MVTSPHVSQIKLFVCFSSSLCMLHVHPSLRSWFQRCFIYSLTESPTRMEFNSRLRQQALPLSRESSQQTTWHVNAVSLFSYILHSYFYFPVNASWIYIPIRWIWKEYISLVLMYGTKKKNGGLWPMAYPEKINLCTQYVRECQNCNLYIIG